MHEAFLAPILVSDVCIVLIQVQCACVCLLVQGFVGISSCPYMSARKSTLVVLSPQVPFKLLVSFHSHYWGSNVLLIGNVDGIGSLLPLCGTKFTSLTCMALERSPRMESCKKSKGFRENSKKTRVLDLTRVLQNTELILECAFVLLSVVTDRSKFTSAVFIHMPLWKNLVLSQVTCP